MSVTGGCLCGAVTYRINGPIGEVVHCHCQTCRKAHSSAFSSVAAVADQDFQLQDDVGKLSGFESSPGKLRWFCSGCGSQLYAKRNGTSHIILRLGSLDDDSLSNASLPAERNHIWVSQQAAWYSREADLPAYAEYESESSS